MRILAILTAAWFATGCASMIVRPDDSAGKKVTKVTTRALLCPVTICMSEIEISNTKKREHVQALEADRDAAYHACKMAPPAEQRVKCLEYEHTNRKFEQAAAMHQQWVEQKRERNGRTIDMLFGF